MNSHIAGYPRCSSSWWEPAQNKGAKGQDSGAPRPHCIPPKPDTPGSSGNPAGCAGSPCCAARGCAGHAHSGSRSVPAAGGPSAIPTPSPSGTSPVSPAAAAPAAAAVPAVDWQAVTPSTHGRLGEGCAGWQPSPSSASKAIGVGAAAAAAFASKEAAGGASGSGRFPAVACCCSWGACPSCIAANAGDACWFWAGAPGCCGGRHAGSAWFCGGWWLVDGRCSKAAPCRGWDCCGW